MKTPCAGWDPSTAPPDKSADDRLVMMRNGVALNNSSYRASTGVRDSRAASRDLRELVDRGLIEQTGTRGTTIYRLIATHVEEASLFDRPDLADETQPAVHLTVIERTVLDFVRRGETSRASVEKATGLAYHQVVRALQSLREKGLIQMNGKHRSRSTTWSVISYPPP